MNSCSSRNSGSEWIQRSKVDSQKGLPSTAIQLMNGDQAPSPEPRTAQIKKNAEFYMNREQIATYKLAGAAVSAEHPQLTVSSIIPTLQTPSLASLASIRPHPRTDHQRTTLPCPPKTTLNKANPPHPSSSQLPSYPHSFVCSSITLIPSHLIIRIFTPLPILLA